MENAFDEDYYEGTEEDKEKFMAEMKAEMEQEGDVAGDWGDEVRATPPATHCTWGRRVLTSWADGRMKRRGGEKARRREPRDMMNKSL